MQALVVPVKSLERAKTRLAGVLGPAERATLSLALLEDVLDACLSQPGWDVLAISRDQAVLTMSAARGARVVAEEGRTLRAAIRQMEAMVPQAKALAVVLADLPFLTVESLSQALGGEAAVTAAPAASDGGTNVLVRRPPAVIPARFGRASFAKHRWAARKAGASFAEVVVTELGFDLDRPEDLQAVIRSPRATRTKAACLDMGLPERLLLHA